MKKILSGAMARKAIKDGVDICVDVVKVSLGAKGSNVLIYNGQKSDIINDGVSIAKEINVENEIHQAGIQLAKQCADQTDTDSGDGTTTTLVLLQAALNEVIQDIQTVNPREQRVELFKAAEYVLSKIKPSKIKDRSDIYNLALTSSLDRNIAEKIADIYDELGKDAKVSVEEVQGDVLESEIVNGVQFESKLAEKKLLNAYEKTVINDVHVLVKDDVTVPQDIQEMIEKVVASGKNELVVIANYFDKNFLLTCLSLKDFKIYPVEYEQLRTLEDIADYVGDKPVDKVVIDEELTTIIGGKGDVDKKVKQLKEKRKNEQSEYEKEELDRRVGNLSGGVAIIKAGKNTDVERNEIILKIDDALGAVKGAYELGYVEGAGKAIHDACVMSDNESIQRICKAPYIQICENQGINAVKIPHSVIDSFKTVKHSLLNALSTATSISTVEAALIEENDED